MGSGRRALLGRCKLMIYNFMQPGVLHIDIHSNLVYVPKFKKKSLHINRLLCTCFLVVTLFSCQKVPLEKESPSITGLEISRAASKGNATNLRVLSFNVLCPCWANPSYYPVSTALLLNRVDRRKTIIDFLKSQQKAADIIALQEVAQVEFDFFRDALKSNYTGFQANHSSTYWSSWITVEPPWELNGNAIFVRNDLFNNLSFQDLPTSIDGNHAALFTGIVKNSGGKTVRAASVHLDSDYPYNRKAELSAVLNAWVIRDNTCDLIAGDFNFETDAGDLRGDIKKAGYYDVLDVLGKSEQTHPWDSKYNGADNWGIIDHVISRNSSGLDGKVMNFDLYKLYPNDEERRINENMKLCGSDHFPIIGSVYY